MAASQETALLYHLQNSEPGRQLKLLLIKMKVRIRMIEPAQYLQPIGALAGIREISSVESSFDGEEFPEPMLILRGFTDSRLDLLLQSMRRQKIRIPLKAILTAENQRWNSLQLYEELNREHQAMNHL